MTDTLTATPDTDRPLTPKLRARAYDALSLMIVTASGERADVLRDIALLAGHPNFPLARPLSVLPGDPAARAQYEAHWSRMVSERRVAQ